MSKENADILVLDDPFDTSEPDFGDGDGDEEEYIPRRSVHIRVGLFELDVSADSPAEVKSLLEASVDAATSLHGLAIEQAEARIKARQQ